MVHYIIDGNNLIGRIKRLSVIHSKNKQSAREQLVFLLQNYFSGKKIKITIHFDGFEKNKLNIQNAEIIYSESVAADDKIKQQIASIKNRQNVIVVSSDNSVTDYAKVCGCNVMRSNEFYRIINIKNEQDDEAKRIKEINNIDEFKKLFNVKEGKS